MRLIKILYSTYFAFVSMIFIRGTWYEIKPPIRLPQTPKELLLWIILDAFCIIMAAAFGTAWWTIWTEKTSAGRWGNLASILNLLMSVGVTFLYYFAQGWTAFLDAASVFGITASIGVSGLFVFSRRHGERAAGLSQV